MLFDKMARMAERRGEAGFITLLNRAKLFVFELPAHGFIPEHYDLEIKTFLEETFFLPFPVIVVEDPASAVMLWDEKPGSIGGKAIRFFVECMPLDGSNDAAFAEHDPGDDATFFKGLRDRFKGYYLFNMGRVIDIHLDPIDTRMAVSGDVANSWVWNQATDDLEKINIPRGWAGTALRNARVALEEILYMNTPNRFIVEDSPRKVREPKPGRIVRSDDRPHYHLMTPPEIKVRMHLPSSSNGLGGTHQSPVPHQRRKHYRTFKADRFTTMKGKTIVIPASWIGPSEGVIGNRKYRVMLDL